MIRLLLASLAGALRASLVLRSTLVLENLALRQQLAVYERKLGSPPRLTRWDRCFWVVLSRVWANWRAPLRIVQPETVIRWHRKGFRLFWRWRSRADGRSGRPRLDAHTIALIRRMAHENPMWGAPRIHAELRLLGITVSQASVSRYMPRRRTSPASQGWQTFLRNHAREIAGADFFVVPTVSFHLLYVWIVILHDSRRVVHFNVSYSPGAAWTALQLTQAFPWDTAPRYLIRDNDGIYGKTFQGRVHAMGMVDMPTARRSPWQNPYAERVIGSIRRDCLDHVIVLNEQHLRRLLSNYLDYYHNDRPHLGLDKQTPAGRAVEGPHLGEIVAHPRCGGLHHRYTRVSAA